MNIKYVNPYAIDVSLRNLFLARLEVDRLC